MYPETPIQKVYEALSPGWGVSSDWLTQWTGGDIQVAETALEFLMSIGVAKAQWSKLFARVEYYQARNLQEQYPITPTQSRYMAAILKPGERKAA